MLRLAVMLDSLTPDAWVAHILSEIQASTYGTIELVVLNTPRPAKQRSTKEKLKAYWKRGLYSRYEAWDYHRHRAAHDSHERTSVADLLKGVPTLQIEPKRKGFLDFVRQADVERIREANPDVILRFGFRILRGPVLDAARYGIWSFHHDDNREYRGGPPLFWEIYENNAVSGTVLQILTSALDAGKVIYRGHSSTNKRSLYLNRNAIYWKTAEYMLRRLRDLYAHGWPYIQALETYNEPSDTISQHLYRTPDSWQMVKFLTGQFTRACRASFTSRTRGCKFQWFLAIRKRQAEPFSSAKGYKVMPVPDDRFYADPFLLQEDGRTWLFFEDYRYAEKQALISCCELDGDGAPGSVFEVLRRPYHLSYPYVFRHEGEFYMIPETKENATVELYKASSFPLGWELQSHLLEGVVAVDATVYRDDHRLWMFVGMSNGRFSTCDELALYMADSLTGPWREHPMSPVVSDVRRARPAGPLFRDGGRLIRPSQNSAESYGQRLNFSEVVTLTETAYEERLVEEIGPGWTKGSVGTHAYSRSDAFEVIDAKRRKRP